MKWSDTWFKMCDSFNEWKGRLVSEKGLETSRGKKTLLAMCCATAVLGIGVYQGYSWYLERDYLLRAESAMRGGFFKEAFKNYLALAQRGDLEAMRQVADMYFEGKGTAKNPDQAIKFLQEAADQGDSEAMTRLGMLYFSSSYQGQTCLGHDYRQAMNWFLKAGRNPEALEAIGTMYLRGLGVETNERLAQNYFDKWIDTYLEKARQGDAKAQYLMGLYLIDGQRHAIDEPKAIAWFEKSAAQGYVKALESLGFLYRIGGENTAPDNEKAMAYFAKLKDIYEERAAKGDTAAMIYLAEMYQKGEGVPQDNAMALKKYLDASDAGSIAAKENLADLTENNVFTLPGGVTPEDLRQQARKLREQKAVEGDITYMKELGFEALSAIASYESEQANRADNAESEDDFWAVRTSSQMAAEQKHLEAQEKAQVANASETLNNNAASDMNVVANKSAIAKNSKSTRDAETSTRKADNTNIALVDEPQDQGQTFVVATLDSASSEGENGVSETVAGSDSLASNEGFTVATASISATGDEVGTQVSKEAKSKENETKENKTKETPSAKAKLQTKLELASTKAESKAKESPRKDQALLNAQELYPLYDEAVKWFTLAAQSGDAPAMLELGRIYRDAPLPSIRNENMAVNWFLKSAQQCYEPAYLELGAVYEQPNSTLENAREAIHWFELAAMQGSTEAQIQLAKLFARGGRGVQPNYVNALKWLLVVKKGAELSGDTATDGLYGEVLELEKQYAHYLTLDEVGKVHHEVQVMVEKYGTNW